MILNPWPQVPGIRLSRYKTGTTTTTMQEVKGASGSIKYLSGVDGKSTRMDEYEVPLSELGVERGAVISVAFYVSSPVPTLVTSSVAGFERGSYYPAAIPVAKYLPIKLQSE